MIPPCVFASRILVLVVWLPPCIMDRIQWSEPGVCKWEPSNNVEFVYFIASCGHHLPCVIMVVCYVKVRLFLWTEVLTMLRVGEVV